jgi:hypothetical protein
MKSKYTTYCGAAAAVATTVATFNFTPMVTKISGCIAACAMALTGYFARDNHISDEQAGAGQTKETKP